MNLGDNNTIPTFPVFKKLLLSDREFFIEYTRRFLPYSDSNFTSLWTWNIEEQVEISILNGNLVILFQDYLTREPFFYFMGTEQVVETITTLLAEAAKRGYTPQLKLIGQEVITALQQEIQGNNSLSFIYSEDEDQHDYVYDMQLLSTMSGKKLRGKKNFINRFEKVYAQEAKIIRLDLSDKAIQEKIIRLFLRWANESQQDTTETANELQAIGRLLLHQDQFSLHAVGIFIDSELIAFAINEFVTEEYVINHYQKAITSYVGVYPFLMQAMNQCYVQKGYRYMNAEQDLGLPGLRKSKQAYQPIFQLKKYRITSATE